MEKVRPWRAWPTLGLRTAEEQNRTETGADVRGSKCPVTGAATASFAADTMIIILSTLAYDNATLLSSSARNN